MRRNFLLLRGLLLALSLWSTIPASAAPISRDDPESSDTSSRGISTARGSAVVVTANPLASKAALAALSDGGTCATHPPAAEGEASVQ